MGLKDRIEEENSAKIAVKRIAGMQNEKNKKYILNLQLSLEVKAAIAKAAAMESRSRNSYATNLIMEDLRKKGLL